MGQALRKSVWQFFRKLNTGLPHGPAITLLRTYLRELKIGVSYTCVLVHNVHSITVHNPEKVQTVHVYTDKKMNKHNSDTTDTETNQEPGRRKERSSATR